MRWGAAVLRPNRRIVATSRSACGFTAAGRLFALRRAAPPQVALAQCVGFGPPRLQRLDVVRALERGGVVHVLLAHAALHLLDGLVLVLLHPELELVQDRASAHHAGLLTLGGTPRAHPAHHTG